MPPEPHNPHPDEVVTPMSAMFPVRAPGPGDVLPHAEAGLGQRYRAGMDVTGSMAAQMSDGTDPELVSTRIATTARSPEPIDISVPKPSSSKPSTSPASTTLATSADAI